MTGSSDHIGLALPSMNGAGSLILFLFPLMCSLVLYARSPYFYLVVILIFVSYVYYDLHYDEERPGQSLVEGGVDVALELPTSFPLGPSQRTAI